MQLDDSGDHVHHTRHVLGHAHFLLHVQFFSNGWTQAEGTWQLSTEEYIWTQRD
jgi:hypothetical protein